MKKVNFIQHFVEELFLMDHWKLEQLQDSNESITKSGISVSYQSSLPDPNTSWPNKETTTGGTVDSILYWQELPYNVQPPKVLMYWHISVYLMKELQLLTDNNHNLHYWYNRILRYEDNCRHCKLMGKSSNNTI